MRLHTRLSAALTAGLLAWMFHAAPSRASEWPSQPIKLYVGFPAGSGADIFIRHFAEKLAKMSPSPVVVENKAGATGNIATGTVARARPDGYHILLAANSNMAGSKFLFKDLPFDTFQDFVPAATFGQIGFILVVSPKARFSNVGEMITELKARGQVKYGYTNQTSQFSTEFLKAKTGLVAVPVPYRTAPDALPDVVDGTLDFMIMDGAFAAANVRSGRLRALAVTTRQRLDGFPDVPTMEQSGIPDYDFVSWWGAYLPRGTPDEIVSKVGKWFNDISKQPETRTFLSGIAGLPMSDSGPEARARLAAEIEKWEFVVKTAGISPK